MASSFSMNKAARKKKRAAQRQPQRRNPQQGPSGASSSQPAEAPSGHTAFSTQMGNEGQATVRLAAVRDPAAHARTLERQRAAAAVRAAAEPQAVEEAPAPRRRRRVPAAPVAEALPAAPPDSTAPVRAAAPAGAPQPVGPPEVPHEVPPEAQIPMIPVRVVGIRLDGTLRETQINASSLLHGFLYEAAGQDEHGQRLFQLRSDAAVGAEREVGVTLANDGPRAKIGVFLFCGDRMHATEIELGAGTQAEVTLTGRFQGHLELGYAPVQV